MLGKISGVSSLVAALAAKKTQAQATGQTVDDQSAIPDSVRRARDALNTLKQANATRSQDRKAAAKAKVDRLKAELQNLRLMSGGDPKAIARRVAQIARELGSAAKEYAASGGGGGGGAEATSADQANSADQATDAQQGGADAQAVPADAAAPAPETEEASATATAEGTEQGGGVAETFRQQAADVQRHGSESEEDAKFAEEVRRLHAQAKSMLREQARRAAENGQDDAEIGRAEREVEAAGQDIQAAFSAAAPVVVPLVLTV